MCNNNYQFHCRHILRKICNYVICPLHILPSSNEAKNKMKKGTHFLFQIDVKDVAFVVSLKTAWLQLPFLTKNVWL